MLDNQRKECYILLVMKNTITKSQLDLWDSNVSKEEVKAYSFDNVNENTIEIRVYDYDFKHDFSSIFRTLREVGVEIDEDEIERSKADFDDYLLHENGTEHRYSGTAFMVYLNLID